MAPHNVELRVLPHSLLGTVRGTPCQLAAARIHFIVVCYLGGRTLARPPEHSFSVLLATLRLPLHVREQELRPVALLGRAVLDGVPLSPVGVALSFWMRGVRQTKRVGRSSCAASRLKLADLHALDPHDDA